MEGEFRVPRSILDELHSSDMAKRKVKVVLLQVSYMNFILGISREIKWKAKVVLVEVSLMNLFLRISNEMKWKAKLAYSKYH